MSRHRKYDIHRMHDGVWCVLIFGTGYKEVVARAFAPSWFAAARAALAQATGADK